MSYSDFDKAHTGDFPNATREQSMSEVSMDTLRQFFEKAASAVVNASDLAKEVAKLQEDMRVMQGTLEDVSLDNGTLRDRLHQVTGERDLARSEAIELSTQLRIIKDEREYAERLASERLTALEELHSRMTMVSEELDEASLEVIRLEELVAKFKGQVESVHKALGVALPEEPTPFAEDPTPASEGAPPAPKPEQPRSETGQFEPYPESSTEEQSSDYWPKVQSC